jgi:hypothetical protein
VFGFYSTDVASGRHKLDPGLWATVLAQHFHSLSNLPEFLVCVLYRKYLLHIFLLSLRHSLASSIFAGCYKKSFTTLKDYTNVYTVHTQRFELSNKNGIQKHKKKISQVQSMLVVCYGSKKRSLIHKFK